MTYFNKPTRVRTSLFNYMNSNGSVTQSTTGSYATGEPEIKTGSSVPGYKDRIFKGIDAGSTYRRSGYKKLEPYVYTMSSHQRWGGQDVFNLRKEVGIACQPVYSFNDTSSFNEASAILKRKLRSVSGQSNQVINIAELKDLPKTIGTLAKSASKLVETVIESKHKGKDLKRYASDQWLNWSFGVLPTLSAVDDTLESIQSFLDRKDHCIREYGVHKTDWVSSVSGLTTGSHHYNVDFRAQYYHHLSVYVGAAYKFQLLSSNNYTLDKHLGFDISNVVPAAWELLPYSWLIDYFTTAGSFIEDTFTGNPGNSIYMFRNTIYRVNGVMEPTPRAIFKQTALEQWNCRPQSIEYYSFKRDPLGSLPAAPLRIKTREEIANHAVNKLLNLTAIIGSRK